MDFGRGTGRVYRKFLFISVNQVNTHWLTSLTLYIMSEWLRRKVFFVNQRNENDGSCLSAVEVAKLSLEVVEQKDFYMVLILYFQISATSKMMVDQCEDDD